MSTTETTPPPRVGMPDERRARLKFDRPMKAFQSASIVAAMAITFWLAPAHAEGRWPQGPCTDVMAAEAAVVKNNLATLDKVAKKYPKQVAQLRSMSAAHLAAGRAPLLYLLRDNCGVDVRAKIDHDIAALEEDLNKPKPLLQSKPLAVGTARSRPSTQCVMVDIGEGTKVMNCD